LEGDESGLWRAVLRLSSEGSEVDRDVKDGGRAEGTRRRASRVGAGVAHTAQRALEVCRLARVVRSTL